MKLLTIFDSLSLTKITVYSVAEIFLSQSTTYRYLLSKITEKRSKNRTILPRSQPILWRHATAKRKKKKNAVSSFRQDVEINVLVPPKVSASVNMYGLTFARTNSPTAASSFAYVCKHALCPYYPMKGERDRKTWMLQ